MNTEPPVILAVDDTPTNLSLLFDVLDKAGFEVLVAKSGKSALEIAEETHPDIILLDIMMPGLDGFETCRRLKAHEQLKPIPVIFMTALTETPDKLKGFDAGAVDYITKPIRPEEVLARVRIHLTIQRLQQELQVKNEELSAALDREKALNTELQQMNQELLEKQEFLDLDLKAAAQIQQSLLPGTVPNVNGFDFAWRFLPCEKVGGDIFNMQYLDASNLAIYLLDVSGHGVSAAMVTVFLSQTLLSTTESVLKKSLDRPPYYEIISPGDMLNRLDQEYPIERFERLSTMVYLIVNIETGHIRYSNAAHPYPVLLRVNGEIELLQKGGSAIGMGGLVPFEEGEIFLQPGDKLFLYTDGIVESSDETGILYGEDRLYDQLQKFRQESLDTICQRVIDSVEAYKADGPQLDDITLFAIERKG